ncbi:hypothetical protein EV175_005668 [Coemansia sp. RSA 1933]|nr:hypothetical protein EV175_005668 [Coemansia sp. RSA 1933]
MSFEMWTPVPVRNAITREQQQHFEVLCVGGCCVVCQSCEHRNLISPSAHNVALCVSCEDPLELPLEAHFACTAKLEKSFAILQAFDIERFFAETAHELSDRRAAPSDLATRAVVGFMDIVISRTGMLQQDADCCPADSSNRHVPSNGIWSAMLASFGLRSVKAKKQHGGILPITSKKHALAVIVDGTLSFYVVHKKPTSVPGSGKHQLRKSLYEQIFSMSLDSVQGLEEHSRSSTAGVTVTGNDVRVEMGLGLSSVASTWMQMLSKRVDVNKHQHQHQHQHQQPASDEFLGDGSLALRFDEKSASEQILQFNMGAMSSGEHTRHHHHHPNPNASLILL